MKVKIKSAYLDKDGLHKKGDVLDVDIFDPFLMVALEEEEPKLEEEEPKEEAKPKTTTKKSKK